ncbi:MAPEG family protein [Altererythrobacter litoralis]|uniref:MAPEG family protein n=1 Tax=Altererythrobacter litoralis TaxID=3113904 RepID=A0ABU7GGX7_9SPHN|nr:MAPEG family protein [Erythrobacteraceae bacterium 1XM1-14]
MQAQMLAPAAVLVAWSIIMLLWTAGTRFPALAKSGMDLKNAKPGGRGQDLEGVLPDKVQWKSHNYTHLMEQPTIFYPTVIILAMMGAGAIDVLLAWAYVALRIIHSLWQSTVNVVSIRFLLFILSTLALTALAVRALSVTLLANPGVVA